MSERAPPETDEDLALRVREARAGSRAAQASLYRRFLPWVHGLLMARHRPAIADELTQECFVLAFERLDQLREPAQFAAWIGAIARHLRSSDSPRLQAIDESMPLIDPGAGPEDSTEAALLLRAIRALPPAYRETLALRLIEGLSGPQIAALTGLDPDSVRVNLHRGLHKLRAALAEVPR